MLIIKYIGVKLNNFIYRFNLIRLHVAFEAAMPIRGEINEEYLFHIRDIVRLAAQYNISVVLDAH